MNKELVIQIVGVLTLIASYSIKLVGFPEQIQKIRKAKSSDGISKSLFIASFISFVLWTVYGILKNDWVIVLAQGLGTLVAGVLLIYMWKYRTKE
jgi:MtN3 and saliva related transmembrane protein